MKSEQLGWVFFALAIVGMSVGAVHADVVAHYGFENADNLGEDSSAAGNDAFVFGSAVQSSSGPFGNAIQLDGFAALKPHLELPDISSHFGAQEGTFAAWVNVNVYPPARVAQSGWAYMGDSPDDTHYPWRDGRAYLDAFRDTRENVDISSQRGCTPNCLSDAELMEWHHVAITSDASDWKVYQNGNLIYQAAASWGFPTAPKVGQGNGGETLDGLMDEVWIGNVALTEGQVNILYTENRFAPEPAAGDFDDDGDIDGNDFLIWQRGDSPNPLSQADLAVWEANYGGSAPLSATSASVPEPTTSALALAALCLAMSRRRIAAR